MRINIKTPIILLLAFTPFIGFAQGALEGIVYAFEGAKKAPLPGATLYWEGTQTGTTSDAGGRFTLKKVDSTGHNLIVMYFDKKPDTLYISTEKFIEINLDATYQVQEVVISESRGTFISHISPRFTETVTKKELLRAACCNLSESFETNPSIDVNFTDAVSGAKTIRMLGLDGVYTQMLQENIPGLRGLSGAYGMSLIPGTWIQSIQITKGAGSVVNGYESMAGQINLELIKPADAEKLLVNLYADHQTRTELNVNTSRKLNDHWSTALLLHGEGAFMKNDRNGDGFLDAPLQKGFSGSSRWDYNSGKKLESQFGVSYMLQDRDGGQLSYYNKPEERNKYYGTAININRIEAYGKLGLVFPEKPWKSIGNQVSFTHHEQVNNFGNRHYSGMQNTFYLNSIYQTIIKTTSHKVKFGASLLFDDFNERFTDSIVSYYDTNSTRQEIVPGAFTEYAFTSLDEKFSLVAGLRADYHNLYGLMLTPRLHTRLALTKTTTVRASVGRGYRTPNIWVENAALLASSREIFITEKPGQEKSWNYGVSLLQDFEYKKKKGHVSADYFHTEFQSQVVADLDEGQGVIVIYNLKGRSFANSFQVEAAYDIIKNLNLKVAGKVYDVQTTYHGVLMQKPLVPKNRFLATASYTTKYKKYVFDATAMHYGPSRLPLTTDPYFLRDKYSPAYWVFHTQVTKNFKKMSVYIGSENLLDFRQKDPIVNAADPFGRHFDASMIWGPVDGRRIYFGLRYKIENE
jgi:outer membrane receptor for ferrienterochelin and colicin